MKILVTGANGYLGRGIVEKLLDKNHEVIAVTRTNQNFIDKRAKIIISNIFETDDPFNSYERPDVLLHLAWENGFKHNDILHIKNIYKHFEFVKKMVDNGINRFIGMGTMHEIGYFEGCVNEDTPINPLSFYGISKDTFRRVTNLVCDEHNITFQWLRAFYIVGNTPTGNSIFAKILQSANRGEKEFSFTSGTNKYDFLDYEEFCNQVVIAVEQNKIKGIINICNGKAESLSTRVQRFINENRLKIKLKYGVYPDRKYDSKALWGDNSKIQCILRKEGKK